MNAEEYSERGGKYFSQRNFDGAIANYTEVIKLEPKNPFAYYKRGLSYTNKKEFDLAIADFTEAIRIEPNKFGNFYFDRGGAYILKGDNALAISDFETARKIDPKNVSYWEALKACYRESLKDIKAEPSADGQPMTASDYLKRGFDKLHATDTEGDPRPAFVDFTEAIRLNPNLAEAYNQRATVYIHPNINDYEKAIADLEIAVKLDPAVEEYRKYLEEYRNDLKEERKTQKSGWKVDPKKSKKVAYLLLIFLGFFGAHYFYIGRKAPGILRLILLAGLIIGLMIGWLSMIIPVCLIALSILWIKDLITLRKRW